MAKYLFITRDRCNNYVIHAVIDGKRYERYAYVWYTKRDAIKRFREQNCLKNKHLEIIEY